MLGGLISPSHSRAVRLKLKRDVRQVIPSMHRIAMCQLAVQDSDWLSVDPWEATRLHMLDYMSLLEHVQNLISTVFPSLANRIQLYLFCKYARLVKLSPSILRRAKIRCICVCRPVEAIRISDQLELRWHDLTTVVEDAAMLSVATESISSARIRQSIMNGEHVEHAVSAAVNEYAKQHRLAQKVRTLLASTG